jgi:uncharacterized peroxidase-related enzyme
MQPNAPEEATMSHESMFHDHTVDSAPEASRAALAGSARHFGFVPAALARMAESPALVEAFNAMLRIFDRSSLSPLEREVLVVTLARVVGCDVCVAIHSATLASLKADAALVTALRVQTPLADARLEALRRFTRAVLDTRGDVGDAALADFLAAGYGRQQALDVVLGVGAYTLSTYANRLTRAPLDAPLEPFRFTSPS